MAKDGQPQRTQARRSLSELIDLVSLILPSHGRYSQVGTLFRGWKLNVTTNIHLFLNHTHLGINFRCAPKLFLSPWLKVFDLARFPFTLCRISIKIILRVHIIVLCIGGGCQKESVVKMFSVGFIYSHQKGHKVKAIDKNSQKSPLSTSQVLPDL